MVGVTASSHTPAVLLGDMLPIFLRHRFRPSAFKTAPRRQLLRTVRLLDIYGALQCREIACFIVIRTCTVFRAFDRQGEKARFESEEKLDVARQQVYNRNLRFILLGSSASLPWKRLKEMYPILFKDKREFCVTITITILFKSITKRQN